MASNWQLHPLRVRYQETDQMSVVFHGNYVTWFEIGRTEWIRSNGFSYKEIEQRGLLLPVIDLHCKFILPAKYDDQIIICTRVTDYSPLRMHFESQIRRVDHAAINEQWSGNEPLLGELLVEGGTNHVWVNESFQPVRLNKAWPELYQLMKDITG